jgi:heat shock protein HslJ
MVTFALLPGFVVIGCARAPKITEGTEAIADSSKMHREWTLVSIGPVGSEETIGEAMTITIAFAEDGRFHGSAGCNRYFGGYELGDGNSLLFKNIGSTMMMCDDEIMRLETSYLEALKNISSYRTEKNSLVLSAGDERKVLVFAHKKSIVQPEPEAGVEFSRSIPFDALNEHIRAAADIGESWVRDPIRIAFEFGIFNEARTLSIKRIYERGENPDSVQVTVIEDGYVDDSVRGRWIRLTMTKRHDGVWLVTQAREAYRCWRGEHQDVYAAEPCP